MAVNLVTYDLHTRGQNYTDLLAKIKEGGMWARLSESSYAVDTTKTPRQLYDYLKTALDSNDHLFILPITKPYWGYGPNDTIEWLNKHLPG